MYFYRQQSSKAAIAQPIAIPMSIAPQIVKQEARQIGRNGPHAILAIAQPNKHANVSSPTNP